MFEFLRKLLEDKETGKFTFEAFSLCHILYFIIIVSAITLTIIFFKDKEQKHKEKLIDITVTSALSLYILDFFLMPFSEGEINIDKLPFHICTLMSVMCFLSRHNKKLFKFKSTFSMMGLLGGLMYLTYPAGVNSADGYSYRIIQTVLYHGLLIAQGVFSIAFKDIELDLKNIKYDVISVLVLVVWAMIGNFCYSGTITESCTCVENCPHLITVYDHDFNWFFVKHDALYVIPDDYDMYIAPFMTVGAILGLCTLIRVFFTKVFVKKKGNEQTEDMI